MAVTDSATPFTVAKFVGGQIYDQLSFDYPLYNKVMERAITIKDSTQAVFAVRLDSYDIAAPAFETDSMIPQAKQIIWQGAVGPAALYASVEQSAFSEAVTQSGDSAIANTSETFAQMISNDLMNQQARLQVNTNQGALDPNSICGTLVSTTPSASATVCGIQTNKMTSNKIFTWQNPVLTASKSSPTDFIQKFAKMIALLKYSKEFSSSTLEVQISDEGFDALSSFAANSFRMYNTDAGDVTIKNESDNTITFNGVKVRWTPYLGVQPNTVFFINHSAIRYLQYGSKPVYKEEVKNYFGAQKATQVWTLYNHLTFGRMVHGAISLTA